MLPEVMLIMGVLLSYGFWKNRKWLIKWISDYPKEFKEVWDNPKKQSNYEMVKVTRRGIFSFACMIMFFVLIFILKPWWIAIIIFLVVYFGGGLLIGLQGGFDDG